MAIGGSILFRSRRGDSAIPLVYSVILLLRFENYKNVNSFS